MTRHLLWQAILAVLGVILVFVILFQLASTVPTETTVYVPARGGTYIEGVLGFSERINPILAPRMVQANPIDQDLSALIFDGLTELDATGQVSACLALDWDISEDGSVYEFYLRDDVQWHDGAPLTATDVAFTIQAIQDPNYRGDANLSALWKNVIVELLDDYTVRLTLDEPFPSFLNYTTIGLLPAHLLSTVPADELPEHSFSSTNPVGTGMFKVARVAADRVVLETNQEYWGPQPYLDSIEFWFYGDWEGMLADYVAGEIQAFHPPTIPSLTELVSMPDLSLYSAQSAGYGIIFLNLQRESLPFFQEPQVRQALLYALNRQELLDQVLQGQGLVADSPILPTTWAYDPTIRTYNYDPERAIGLLDASGWMDSDNDRIRDQDDQELEFTLLVSTDPTMQAVGQLVAQQWAQVGIDVTVRKVTNEVLTDQIYSRDFDAALTEVGLLADPDPYPLWHSTQAEESGQNFSGFASPEADQAMEEARLTSDQERRTELYHAFQRIFADEVPSLLLYYPVYTYAVDAQVKQVQIAPMLHTSDRFRNVDDWTMETEEVVVTQTGDVDKNPE